MCIVSWDVVRSSVIVRSRILLGVTSEGVFSCLGAVLSHLARTVSAQLDKIPLWRDLGFLLSARPVVAIYRPLLENTGDIWCIVNIVHYLILRSMGCDMSLAFVPMELKVYYGNIKTSPSLVVMLNFALYIKKGILQYVSI